jgi:GntR family transcriptional regulator, transcriptional repressor for pyruvate dehydrogenase complex
MPDEAEIEEHLSAEFTEVRRQPLYLQVAHQIREAIAKGRFAPGESLPPERELSEAFGASRASVREALRALQAQGVIVAGGAPSRAVVSDELDRPAREALAHLLRLNDVGLADLVDLRCLIETAAIAAAVERGEPERFVDARRALEAMEDPEISIEDFDEADIRFHVALVRASGNEAMHLVMLALREPVEKALLKKLREDPRPRDTLRRLVGEHGAILEALEDGDAERAGGLLDRHIRGFYRQPARG